MKFRFRIPIRLGPFAWWFTQRGFTSWSAKLGRLSHNFTHRQTNFDTPGPGYLTTGRRRRRRRRRR